jgi:DNA invertase Pin-like site-specific DNA recombinase
MQISKIEALPEAPRKKRVAAYARVSSGKDAMLHSLSVQISYYSELIQKNPEWEYVSVYADEAETGTRDTQPQFQQMLKDCRDGKIDRILTKSISRLSRNTVTVTVLQSVQALRELGVDIFFEKENIHSQSPEGDFLMTILSSYAQEESLSCSENCKWHIRKQFRDGKPTGGNMLGYRLQKGVYTIIPKEAELVRQIYDWYLEGCGFTMIERLLKSQGVNMSKSGISQLLRNEKYYGSMTLQKTFVLDHIFKKKMKNTGQLPMYHVEDSHEAIISKKKWDAVQAEIKLRAQRFKAKPVPPPTYPFTGMIRCGICGAHYRRKITASGTKYAKVVWICGTFNTYGKSACASRQIPEDILKEKTVEALHLPFFDESLFKMHLKEIVVPEPGKLVFVYDSGNEVSINWENPSRRESWTAEMKETARQRQLDRVQGVE